MYVYAKNSFIILALTKLSVQIKNKVDHKVSSTRLYKSQKAISLLRHNLFLRTKMSLRLINCLEKQDITKLSLIV